MTCGFSAIEMPDTGWSGVAGRYQDVMRVEASVATFVSRTIAVHQRVALSRL